MNAYQRPFFLNPALSNNTAGRNGQNASTAPKSGNANEFANVLDEAMGQSTVATPAPGNVVYPAQLANTAYWAHPSYSQAMRKAS